VQKIKVQIVGFQSLQLFREICIHLFPLPELKERHLGGKVDLFPPSSGQRLADENLAFSALAEDRGVINVGGIDKIDAMIDCIMKQLRRLRIVYFVSLVAYGREPHAPKSEDRKINACFSEFSIKHEHSFAFYAMRNF
jgi:hypothetical protein